MNFCKELKKARAATGLTQKALASIIGVPTRTYESWEMGERMPASWVQRLLLEKINSMARQ